MKQVLLLFTFIVFLMLSGCQTKTKSTSAFTKEVYTPEYATGFDIMGADNTESTIIHVRNPWQGAEGVEMSYFVARNGEQAPKDFDGVIIPVLALMSSFGPCVALAALGSTLQNTFAAGNRCHKPSGSGSRSFRNELCFQPVCPCTQRNHKRHGGGNKL